ncbi:hypothetical protein DBR42_05330 [Pelomonas sp. HMWF004]|nr:hypothetical protein DBR42_05330 [Pelomonas sp. HMWF004]
MAYTLQAIITRAGALSEPLPYCLRRVALPGGVDMIPIGKAALKAHAFPFLPLTDEGNEGLPSVIANLCERLSTECLLAYVEAEFFGGVGVQAHALFSAGKIFGPVVVSGVAINDALRHLGVQKGEATDEFDVVGLGQRRNTDDWLE